MAALFPTWLEMTETCCLLCVSSLLLYMQDPGTEIYVFLSLDKLFHSFQTFSFVAVWFVLFCYLAALFFTYGLDTYPRIQFQPPLF